MNDVRALIEARLRRCFPRCSVEVSNLEDSGELLVWADRVPGHVVFGFTAPAPLPRPRDIDAFVMTMGKRILTAVWA